MSIPILNNFCQNLTLVRMNIADAKLNLWTICDTGLVFVDNALKYKNFALLPKYNYATFCRTGIRVSITDRLSRI